MKKIFIIVACATAMIFTSCENLDLQPESTTSLMDNDVFTTYDGYHGTFLKLYASMATKGQGGDGGNDISWDGGRSVYLRALFWANECPTDIVMYRTGSGYGIRNTISMDWTTGTEFPQYVYYRAYIIIAMCNEFLRKTEPDVVESYGMADKIKNDVGYWRAEARFIRAYQYYWLCDMYGSVGFVDDSTPNGTYPVQKTRKEIYDYIVSELLDIEDDMLPASQKVFGRANQVSAWFLLSKMYINCKVYTGEGNDYDKAYTYAKKVIDDQNFSLAPNYIENFLKDNETCNEIIWAIPSDSEHMQCEGITNYLLKFPTSSYMLDMVDYGISETWSGNGSLHMAFVDKFLEEDQNLHLDDTWGDRKKDKRSLLFLGPETEVLNADGSVRKPAYQKETWIEGSTYNTSKVYIGAAMTKWRNVTKDRVKSTPTKYSSIAFPVFRKADAYLVAAEAIMRRDGKANDEALKYVNEVRERAYCSGKYYQADRCQADGDIALSDLTLDFLIDERARELWTENWRRSDLIRFDKYTKNYNWDWKGCATSGSTDHEGHDIDDKYKLYPIPQDDILYNPNLKQNPDYE